MTLCIGQSETNHLCNENGKTIINDKHVPNYPRSDAGNLPLSVSAVSSEVHGPFGDTITVI
jgi:hypothetical protein